MAKLGELLVAAGKLSQRDVERTLIAQSEMGGFFGQVLVKLGLVSEGDVAAIVADQLAIPLVGADQYPSEPIRLAGLSMEFLLSNSIVPILENDEKYVFAATIPQDKFLRKALDIALPRPVEVLLGLESDINSSLQKFVAAEESQEEDTFTESFSDDQEFIEHLKDLASEAPIIRLVNQLIHKALDLGASDIHIEPFGTGLHVRYRVDGVLQHSADAPQASFGPAIASRIKLLANLNIAERRLPQDGRIMIRVKGHELDLRVSTIPTVHGESIVMRVLDRESIRLSLASMGFSDDTLQKYRELLSRPHGVLLLTGPTGSGKTTTLYASLVSLDSSSLKVITVEDPVEYQLDGINQIQVKNEIELDFSRSLRAILRQDPDIIMIGEMRDRETAQTAVQSALTGHLVLSTLHTNTAAAAITRLEDMGIERFLITSAVNGVLAQRLVRTLCEHCKSSRAPSTEELKTTGLSKYVSATTPEVYVAVGCDACQNTGYKGRTGIHELFVMDAEIHEAILGGGDATELYNVARDRGMTTLYEDGLRKVASGVTSMEEILRVTLDQREEEEAPAFDDQLHVTA